MCRVALLLAVLLPAGLCRGDTFTVWQVWPDIWARNETTNHEWNLTESWDWPASSPDVAGATAVFATSAGGFPIIAAYDLDDRFPPDIFEVWISVMDGAPVFEPHVGVVATEGYGDYWCAWKMKGGIWANHIKPPVIPAAAYEALPAYSGWFDVEGDQLLYDGGSLTLKSAAVPEPGAMVLLVAAGLCLCVRLCFRRYG